MHFEMAAESSLRTAALHLEHQLCPFVSLRIPSARVRRKPGIPLLL